MNTDPANLLRIQVQDRRIVVGRDYRGRRAYFTLPVFVTLRLGTKLQTSQVRQAFLKQWVATQVRTGVMSSGDIRLPMSWRQVTYQEAIGPNGAPVGMVMATGQANRTGLPPIAVLLVGAVVSQGGHTALVGTGLAMDHNFQRVDANQRQLALQDYGTVARQVLAVAALAKIRMGRRDRSMERKLRRRGRFLHASRYSSRTGGISTQSFSSTEIFDLRFLPRGRCRLKTNSSNMFSAETRSLQDSVGADPRFQVNAAGGRPTRMYPAAPCQVRRGLGGKKWLLIAYPQNMGGPQFFKIERRKSRRCGRRTVRAMAIGGLVEGVFSQFGLSCVYTAPHRVRTR